MTVASPRRPDAAFFFFWAHPPFSFSCWIVWPLKRQGFRKILLLRRSRPLSNYVEGKHLLWRDAELMFYVEHAENSPASVLINCLKHWYLMGYYGTTCVVCCSRLCFGSIPGLEFSLSIPSVVILIFRGMLKLMLPSYVWLNQRCQRPCPNAALKAWLPVLPKDTPAIDKMFFMSFYFIFLCDFSTVLTY